MQFIFGLLLSLAHLALTHADEPRFKLVFYHANSNRFAIVTATEGGRPVLAAEMRADMDRVRWYDFSWQLYFGTSRDMRAQFINVRNVEPVYSRIEMHTSLGARAILANPQGQWPELVVQDPTVSTLLFLEELTTALAGPDPGALANVAARVQSRNDWIRDRWTRVTFTEAEFKKTFRYLKDVPPREMSLSAALGCEASFER